METEFTSFGLLYQITLVKYSILSLLTNVLKGNRLPAAIDCATFFFFSSYPLLSPTDIDNTPPQVDGSTEEGSKSRSSTHAHVIVLFIIFTSA